jgi:hypothetical protein
MLLRVLDCQLALIANDLAADLPAGQAQPDAQVAPPAHCLRVPATMDHQRNIAPGLVSSVKE